MNERRLPNSNNKSLEYYQNSYNELVKNIETYL